MAVRQCKTARWMRGMPLSEVFLLGPALAREGHVQTPPTLQGARKDFSVIHSVVVLLVTTASRGKVPPPQAGTDKQKDTFVKDGLDKWNELGWNSQREAAKVCLVCRYRAAPSTPDGRADVLYIFVRRCRKPYQLGSQSQRRHYPK